MSTSNVQRTSRGGHERQRYTSQRDPGVIYEIEHNHTDYWVILGGKVVAAARFRSEGGKDPGWRSTHEKAIEMIEAFYRCEHRLAHGPGMIDHCVANGLLWRELLDTIAR
jgi:hypothetical protein